MSKATGIQMNINGVQYVEVWDEGLADSWYAQIQEEFGPDYHGPLYIYPTNTPECVVVSKAPLNAKQLLWVLRRIG